MGAGPSRERVVAERRKVLKTIAREYGGDYVRAGVSRNYPDEAPASFVRGVDTRGRWELHAPLLRASNGEACLIFEAIHNAGPKARNLSPQEALRLIGLNPL